MRIVPGAIREKDGKGRFSNGLILPCKCTCGRAIGGRPRDDGADEGTMEGPIDGTLAETPVAVVLLVLWVLFVVFVVFVVVWVFVVAVTWV